MTFDDVAWRIPYCTVSYLFVQAMRKRGVKGIGRDSKSDLLWKRFRELQG